MDNPKTVDVFFDIEADGLLDQATRIWCFGAKDTHSNKFSLLLNKQELVEYIRDIPDEYEEIRLIGHNIIGFDLPCLMKVWNVDYRIEWSSSIFCARNVKIIDTFHLSMFMNPDRPWGHSLAAWGQHLGFEKGDHNDWSQFSEEMATYNERDVEVTIRVFEELNREYERKYK